MSSWGEPPERAPEIVWTAEAIFKVLDLHFAGRDARRRDSASFAQSLHVLRQLTLGNDAAPGALEQTTAAWLDELAAATKRLEQIDAALARFAAKEAAAEQALERGEILPLRRRASEERPL